MVTGSDGIKRTELVTSRAADRVQTQATVFGGEELRDRLAEIVLSSPAVPARRDQRTALEPIMEAFLRGLGLNAEPIMSAHLERAGARLVKLVAEEQRQYMAKPWFEEVVELRPFTPRRATDRPVSRDRFGAFDRSVAYDGWRRSLFSVEWFDSRPERTAANLLDDADDVRCWVRLHPGELPILWSTGREYNPDFIAIEAEAAGGRHWIVEIKGDRDMASPDVVGKRDAARRWANHVNLDKRVTVRWGYLLAAASDIDTAKGSWPALKKLAAAD